MSILDDAQTVSTQQNLIDNFNENFVLMQKENNYLEQAKRNHQERLINFAIRQLHLKANCEFIERTQSNVYVDD